MDESRRKVTEGFGGTEIRGTMRQKGRMGKAFSFRQDRMVKEVIWNRNLTDV
jgi:hypothetical protein